MSFNGLDENSPKIKQPKGLGVKLRPHQLTSIAAMRELEKQSSIIVDRPEPTSGLHATIRNRIPDINEFSNSTFVIGTNSAILADKVGSGKTYMILGLILEKNVPEIHDKYVMGTDHFSIKMITAKETTPVNLIVVPHNLANQWEEFIQKSKLSYLKLNSINDFDVFFDVEYVEKKEFAVAENNNMVLYKQSRKKIVKGIKKTNDNKQPDIFFEKRTINPKKINKILGKTNIFILNVNRYKFFRDIFRSTKWARVIIDEMDSANIPSTFNEYGNFNWFLTATPTSIFYKSCRGYVNRIFGYNQYLLDYFIVKNNDEYVDKSVVLPKPIVYMANSILQRMISAIRDLIPHDVMQMINAGNMKEAVSKLNCNVDTEENIINVLTEKIKTEMHNLKTELKYLKNLIPHDQDAHDKKIKKIRDDIKRCKIKLETVNERVNSIKDECCFICAGTFNTPAILNCCKSVFCLKCLIASLEIANNKCPYCRHVIKSNKEYHIICADKKKKKKEKEDESVTKFEELDKSDVLEHVLKYIARHDESPRILIFSDYPQTFEKIINNIAKAEMQYSLLSGVPSHITNVINEFNEGIINILMLDSQHYGSGLNLQTANYLILYHRMTPELETQVIGRAHRFGRKIPLKIIYLVNESENRISNLCSNPIILNRRKDLKMINNPPEQDDKFKDDDETSELIDEPCETFDDNESDNNMNTDEIDEEFDESEEESPKNKKKFKKSKKFKISKKSKRVGTDE